MCGRYGLFETVLTRQLVNHVAAEKSSPIIRVPVDAEWMIKRALDAGAHGVMTPMCHTPDDARRIVRYSKYPPLGTRGYGPMFSGHAFGVPEAQYPGAADDTLLVIVQIESRQAVDNVEEIAKVPGIDVLFIGELELAISAFQAHVVAGPYDLSKFLNVQFGSEEHEAAIQKTLKAAKSAGKTAAIFCEHAWRTHLPSNKG